MLSDVLNSHINNFNIVAFTRNNYIGYMCIRNIGRIYIYIAFLV